MNNFLSALQFLTIIHFGKDDFDVQRLSKSKVYFPLIGALLGLILIGSNYLLLKIFPEPLLSLTLVAILAVLTGALHLDGFADTVDAFGGGKNKEEILNIMRDSRIGTFGVLSLILIILFKISLIYIMPQNLKNLSLFLMTTLSRYSMNLGLYFFQYARNDGKAKIFFEDKNVKIFSLATLITLILTGMTLKWIGVLALLIVVITTASLNMVIRKKIDGLTGDTLGAVCELNEILILFCIFLFGKLWII